MEAKKQALFGNEKWDIMSVTFSGGMTEAWVIDKKKVRRVDVLIEHIQKGQKLLYGGVAKKTYDNFVDGNELPRYIKEIIVAESKKQRGDV